MQSTGSPDAPSAGDTRGPLASALQPLVEARGLAGAVLLVASKDAVLTTEAVGWMDVVAQTPMRSDALFWIASQTKPITGAAVMTLVDEEKVAVDDPVEKYLPEFRGQMVVCEEDEDHLLLRKPHHPPLVREVLSHSSGLPFASPIERPSFDMDSLATRVRSYAMLPLRFEPGTKSSYSNAGINTAARIAEVVSGMPFAEFLDSRVLHPLGMADTTFWPSAQQLSRLAKAYRPTESGDGLRECEIEQLHYPLDDPSRQPIPAGGLFSTALDVSLFYRMLANGGILDGRRILSEGAVQQMTSDQSGEARSNYGFGIGSNGVVFTHGGAYNTNSAYDRQLDLLTVFLSQHAAWSNGGDTALPTFQRQARELFAERADPNASQLVVGIRGEKEARS